MRRWIVLALCCVIGSLGLAACGGDDSKTSTKGDAATDGSGDGSTGDTELDALVEKAKNAVIRVTYESGDSTFTVSQDGDRTAVIQDDGSKLVEVDGKTYSCTAGSDAQCMEMPGTAVSSIVSGLFGAFAFVAVPGETSNAFVDVSRTDDRSVAGRDAICTTISGGKFIGTDASITACLDQETGVFLLGEAGSGSDTSKIEATDVGEPQDSDFELTGDVTELPAP